MEIKFRYFENELSPYLIVKLGPTVKKFDHDRTWKAINPLSPKPLHITPLCI